MYNVAYYLIFYYILIKILNLKSKRVSSFLCIEFEYKTKILRIFFKSFKRVFEALSVIWECLRKRTVETEMYLISYRVKHTTGQFRRHLIDSILGEQFNAKFVLRASPF